MKWSIKSFLARIANRNSSMVEESDQIQQSPQGPLTNYDDLAGITDSSYYQSIHSEYTTDSSALPVTDLFLCSEQDTESMDIIVEIADTNDSSNTRRLRFCFNIDLMEDEKNQFVQEMVAIGAQNNQMTIKSILKEPTKNRDLVTCGPSQWEKAGFLWKDRATPMEQQFMVYLLEMIDDQGRDFSLEDFLPPPTVIPPRVYDLESYEIIPRPPSIVDLTLYDDTADEFGVFFNQRFIVTNYLMEGSPCGICQPDANTGLKMFPKPVSRNVRTAKIVDSHELPPVFWTSPDEFNGEYLEDEQEEARYKALQLQMVDNCNQRDYKTNPLLEEFKNGTWRLTIFEESEDAFSVDAKRQMTSGEIQQMFGLSDAGSIILNVDHIDVVQGKCGFNRGKATRRFMVPLGQEALKRDRMRDIRRKWNSLFNSYSVAVGNFFGET